jgi:hypothetical protein
MLRLRVTACSFALQADLFFEEHGASDIACHHYYEVECDLWDHGIHGFHKCRIRSGIGQMGNLRSNYRQDHIEDDEQYETDKTFNLLCLKNGGAYRYRKVGKSDRHKELDQKYKDKCQ